MRRPRIPEELFGFDRTRELSAEPAEEIAQAAQAFGQDGNITVLKLTLEPGTVQAGATTRQEAIFPPSSAEARTADLPA